MDHRHHDLGKRRTALAAAAAYDLTRALAYLPSIRTTPVQEPLIRAAGGSEIMFGLYIAAWTLAGLFCLTQLRHGRLLLPMSLTAGLAGMWGTAWLIGWLQQPDTTWWQTAFTYWCPAIALIALTALTPSMRGDEE